MPAARGARPDWSTGRALLYQLGGTAPAASSRPSAACNNFYDALRTKRYVYVELNRVNRETGECDRPEYELYDLKKDPYELENIAVDPASRTPSRRSGRARRPAAHPEPVRGGRRPRRPGARPFCE